MLTQHQQKEILKNQSDNKRKENAPDLMVLSQYNLKEMIRHLK